MQPHTDTQLLREIRHHQGTTCPRLKFWLKDIKRRIAIALAVCISNGQSHSARNGVCIFNLNKSAQPLLCALFSFCQNVGFQHSVYCLGKDSSKIEYVFTLIKGHTELIYGIQHVASNPPRLPVLGFAA